MESFKAELQHQPQLDRNFEHSRSVGLVLERQRISRQAVSARQAAAKFLPAQFDLVVAGLECQVELSNLHGSDRNFKPGPKELPEKPAGLLRSPPEQSELFITGRRPRHKSNTKSKAARELEVQRNFHPATQAQCSQQAVPWK